MTAQSPDTAEQFSRQAEAYANSPSHAQGADLAVVADFAAATTRDLCLDVVTGPGHMAFRIAADAGFAIGADLATGMVKTARRLARERRIANTAFLLADVHGLPFAAGCFDLVTCRIAPHHFADIEAAIREVARVLKPGGRFVVEDSLAPDEAEEAAFLERLEKRRDPTHVHSLTRGEWLAVMEAAGLAVTRETVHGKHHDFELWIRRTGLDEAAIAAISKEILAAPEPLRQRLFDIDGSRVTVLHDRKLILRADKAVR